jgi:hypothetical protein
LYVPPVWSFHVELDLWVIVGFVIDILELYLFLENASYDTHSAVWSCYFPQLIRHPEKVTTETDPALFQFLQFFLQEKFLILEYLFLL